MNDGNKTAGSDLPLSRLDRLAADSNLSRRQLLIWIAQQLNPDLPLFNMILSFRIEGKIDPDRFRQAFCFLIEATDALRTVIGEEDGIPQQRVVDPMKVGLEFIDFSREPDPAAVYQVWVSQREKRLDHSRRLFDSALIRTSDKQHYWYLNLDHLITDAWSFSLIYQRMELFYRQVGSESQKPLDPVEPKPSLLEHCRWERDQQSSRQYRRAQAYWERRLENQPPELRLYGKRPVLMSCPLVRVRHRLDDRRSSALQALTERDEFRFVNQNVTRLCLFTTILAAYFHRVSGEKLLSIGVPFHNRRTLEAEQVVGPLMEICPLLFTFKGGESFIDVYRNARAEVLGALKYSQFSLVNPIHSKIYNVAVNYFLATLPKFSGLDACCQWVSAGYMEEGEMLTVQVEDQADSGQFVLQFDFNSELFSEMERKRVVGHFLRLLDGLLENPEQAVDGVSILPAEEKTFLLTKCSGVDSYSPVTGTVVQLFEQRVRLRPADVALEYQGEQLTYNELNQRANRLAHRLRKIGVGREVVVGLICKRSIASIVGLLGIMKAGGVYLPLPPEYPEERLLVIARDAVLNYMISTGTPCPGLTRLVKRTLTEEGELADLDSESAENLEPLPQPEDAAYLLYTSGTTGIPNGTLVEHRSWYNFVLDGIPRFGVTRESRFLQFASLGFDVSLFDVGLALGSGATLVLEPAEELYPGPELITLLNRLTITHLAPTPSALSGLSPTGLSALEVVIVGGHRCSGEIARRWSRGRRLFNAYGPTEATINTTYHECGSDRGHPPIGRPIANVFIYVLDDQGEPVPQGVPGELHIGGAGLARGYRGKLELTAEKFIPDHLSGLAGSRIYKSGDVVRIDEQGNLAFVGRRDRQVKVRGYRIELEEIEKACSEIRGLRDCAVCLEGQQSAGEKVIAAYFTAKSSLSTLSLRRELREKLPGFMIPAKMVQLDRLPMTSNQKIDYQALNGFAEKYMPDDLYQAPGTEEEIILARLWAEYLGLDRVGIHDSYFDLGGDSLIAMQIVARASQQGISFPIKDLFRHQTIAELAAAVGRVKPRAGGSSPITGTVPLTPIQQLFFRHCQGDPEDSVITVTIELAPEVTARQLEEVLSFTVNHHDALRMRYFRAEGEWIQEIVPPGCRPLFQIVGQQQYSGRAEEYFSPFTLSDSPLLRVIYLEAGDGRHDHVSLFFHHLVMDAYSLRILLNDLETLLGQLQKGQHLELPAKGSSYKEWSERLLAHAQSLELRSETSFWSALAEQTGSLAEDPGVKHSLSSQESLSGREAQVAITHLEEDVTTKILSETGIERDVTTQALLLCSLLTAWHRSTGRETLYLALEDHGREIPLPGLEVLGTIGWFTSIYPLQLRLVAENPSGRLCGVMSQLATVSGRGWSFGLLRYLTEGHGVRELMKTVPEPGISFNFLGQLGRPSTTGRRLNVVGDPLQPLLPWQQRRFWPLQIDALIQSGRLKIHWNGLHALLGADQANIVLEAFEEELGELLLCC